MKEIPLYGSVYKLILSMEGFIKNFPKDLKPTYGDSLRNTGIELLKYVCLAQNFPQDRVIYLNHALSYLETYKIMVRLCHDLRCLNDSQTSEIDLGILDIDKQINGWINKTTENFFIY